MKNKITLILLLTSLFLQGQEITNVSFAQSGNEVTISYDLTHTDNSLTYEIAILRSTDGGNTFGVPLTSVSGAVGVGQQSGTSKQVVWTVSSGTSITHPTSHLQIFKSKKTSNPQNHFSNKKNFNSSSKSRLLI